MPWVKLNTQSQLRFTKAKAAITINPEKYFKKYGEIIWKSLTDSLSDYPQFQGLTEEQIYQIQLTRWLFAHGFAFQVANHPPEVWGGQVEPIIQQGSIAILEGLKKQFASNAK